MPKYPLKFLALHTPFFMYGTNLGDKIDTAKRPIRLLLDDDRSLVWVLFKEQIAFIPLASVASADAEQVPADVIEALGAKPQAVDLSPKRGPGRPSQAQLEAEATIKAFNERNSSAPITVPIPTHDPNDLEAVARHRALVQAASANANRPQHNQAQTDDLIQATRNTAMGMKLQRTAQVQTAQQVGESVTSGVTGKKKAISHAELRAQVAKEMKDPNA